MKNNHDDRIDSVRYFYMYSKELDNRIKILEKLVNNNGGEQDENNKNIDNKTV